MNVSIIKVHLKQNLVQFSDTEIDAVLEERYLSAIPCCKLGVILQHMSLCGIGLFFLFQL